MIELKKEEKQAIIAKNIAQLLDDMCENTLAVNLGAGFPVLVVQYLNNENIFIH